MCGVAAILTGRAGADLGVIREAVDRIRHRGPDDGGFVFLATGDSTAEPRGARDTPAGLYESRLPYSPRTAFDAGAPSARAVLGHRRLSILDLSPSGHQPMSSADGRYWIAFNGEIYNYIELRVELEAAGERFNSRSDTEVILAAFHRWGPACLERFDGMWAFVLYDTRDNRVFVSRDRFGIKPMYYAAWNGGLAFASEIKALLELPGVSRKANPRRLYDYLVFGITDRGDETLFEAIRQLPSAHSLDFPLDRPEAAVPKPYWVLDPERRLDVSFDEAAELVREQFLKNVRLHLRSDVPVGAALSGGIDSSSIVMSIRQVQDQSVDLHAFSYVAGEADIDEEVWIDLVGRRSGALVHKVKPDPGELARDLDYLVSVQDEPFGGTSIYAQHRVFLKARETGIKVMLDGQGADELFAGYPYYTAARIASLARSGEVTDAWRLLRAASRLPGARFREYVYRVGECFIPPSLQTHVRPLVGKPLAPDWIDVSWFLERGVEPAPIHDLAGADPFRNRLRQALRETSLPMLLRYEDRNSMANSIESRVPFLTAELADLCFSLPPEYLIAPDGTTKAVLRRAMRGIVPDEVLDRRDKIGFATPEQKWLRQLRPWAEQILGSETARRIPLLRLDALKAEWNLRLAGGGRNDFTTWRWINLIRWAELCRVEF